MIGLILSDSPPPLRNDLQAVVEPETAAVQGALALLQTLPNTLAVAMSGSGPSCFALFADLAGCLQAEEQLRPQLERAGPCPNGRITGGVACADRF